MNTENARSIEIAETTFEPRRAATSTTAASTGSECRWARVIAYEPPNCVVISWDISPQWQLETDLENTSSGKP